MASLFYLIGQGGGGGEIVSNETLAVDVTQTSLDVALAVQTLSVEVVQDVLGIEVIIESAPGGGAPPGGGDEN